MKKQFVSVGLHPETKMRLKENGRFGESLDAVVNRSIDALLREQDRDNDR
jgi:hypothetical protein